MFKKVVALAKRLYAIRSVDRAIWTLAELGVGAVATKVGDNVYYGVSAAAVLFAVKEFIATKLMQSGLEGAAPSA